LAGGRPLIPKTPLGGPLRVCFMQGWGLSFFQFLFSIFRQSRPKLASGRVEHH
jgi:hypothetical protein